MFLYLIFLTFILILFNKWCLKNNYLVSESGDVHQKFASKIKTPLTGGIFIFFSLIFYLNNLDFLFLFFSLLVLLLGLVSDLKIIKSANRRLLFQIIIVFVYIFLSDLQISDTRLYFLNEILKIKYFNYFFVIFCVLILINGSNFFDGLNTLNIGYFLSVSLIINYLILNNILFVDNFSFYKYLVIILISAYVLNSINKFFLGDSGSYLLGFLFSIILINLYESNKQITPFYIILLLWYPCFENMFSIIRKRILNRSSMKPDSNHLHQLIFYFIKKKLSVKITYANLLSANLINIFNLLIFFLSINFISNTKIIIIFIMLNLIVYTVIYYILFNYRYKKL